MAAGNGDPYWLLLTSQSGQMWQPFPTAGVRGLPLPEDLAALVEAPKAETDAKPQE